MVQALSIATIMVWLGIFVAVSSFHSASMMITARQDSLLMLACMLVAPILGLLGVSKKNITCVRFNAGFNCIGGCCAFAMIGVISVSLMFAEDYYRQCEDATKKDPYCAEISESTKENLMTVHKNQ